MTPRNKAIELYNKFYDTSSHPHHVEARQQIAKKFALIAVNEILDMPKIASFRRDETYMELEYWLEVKQEIEKQQLCNIFH